MSRPSQTTCSYCSYPIRLVNVAYLAAEFDGSNEAAGPPKLHYSSSVAACPMQAAARTFAAIAKGSVARGLDWAAAPITDTDSSSPATTAANFIIETTCMEEATVKQATATAAEEFDIKKRRLVKLNIG